MNNAAAVHKAMETIEQEGIPLSHVTLTIWYLYYAGTNDPLNARLKSLMSTGQPISESAYEKLYENFVLKAHFNQSLGIDHQTTSIIDRANDLKSKIHDFVGLVQQHQINLGDMRDSLSLASTRESVEIILSEAVAELKSVENNSVETTLWMQQNLDELETIRQEVIEIEQSLTRDFLTGLPDKDYFEKTMLDVIDQSMSGVVSKRHLVVFDIKQLSYYNNKYSWLLGDSIIRLVVKMIQAQTLKDWQMMRYEEDAIAVLPPASVPGHQLPDYIESIMDALKKKKVLVKGTDEAIKNIELNAVIVQVFVYDETRTIAQKIHLGLQKLKEDDDLHLVQIDSPEG
ncbi:GGDEF domain-containing protein [Thiomicrospira sp. WB1]|uniref:GGDEF domain-containing protein n=1 Tax=Thiomicrospira sp. WB1 TaxID=1685380 RepID=UPI00074A6468|nr:GGDEF domain-containing protein [Thiomicrospira sp. WB1]KUJ73103.1 hypothetical protein AVO41_04175 [Thiomicrospira sp. WB1]